MIASLLYFLFFETIQPSYGTFAAIAQPSALIYEIEHNGIPKKTGDSIKPFIEAKSAYAIDLASGAPLFAQDIFVRRGIASIEKLVTAMVILDNHELHEKVVVSKNAATQEGSEMGLVTGEEITVENLLIGMLVNSGNDAAVALAEFDFRNETDFVKKMNEKMAQLNLWDTHFTNAKGFDEKNNYSTAYDTMSFSRAALAYPFIRKTVNLKEKEVTSINGTIKHPLKNTNELLGNPYFSIIGLKTGRTPDAGQSFVSLIKMPRGREIITVVLDSPDRFKETLIMVDWIFRNYAYSQY